MEILRINDTEQHGLILGDLKLSIKQAIDSPSFNQLIYQGAKKERIEALLAVLILKYSNMLSVGGNLKQGQSLDISKSVVIDYPSMSLDDFNILLSNGVKGRYNESGKIFRFDISIIYDWIRSYQEEYWDVKEAMPKQKTALEMLPDDKLIALQEVINKADHKPIRSISESDIKAEGRQKPLKPKYTPPDESYIKLQELKAEYGRTCRDLHTGRVIEGMPETFEEWMKTSTKDIPKEFNETVDKNWDKLIEKANELSR